MSDAVHDVRPEQYTTVIREMMRHENDVTNHRIMWLLVGQGYPATFLFEEKVILKTVDVRDALDVSVVTEALRTSKRGQ